MNLTNLYKRLARDVKNCDQLFSDFDTIVWFV
jgi:hypothetical protein